MHFFLITVSLCFPDHNAYAILFLRVRTMLFFETVSIKLSNTGLRLNLFSIRTKRAKFIYYL